ncbi:hypothetical protein QTP86_001940 [Hemibagrus guttatus]|nr:hypothetical protein QTP86_001940 [Hemibagrus guttatus]
MQCGFRPSRGTLDQLYTLHRVLEGSWEFAQTVHMCELGELELGVHLEKAFDRVPRGILWEVLWEYGVRGPLIRALYNRSRSLVHIASCKSDLFPVHVGPRQGCPLSPVLFIVFMDRISRRSQGLEGVRFGDHRISSLIFADDVVLLASSSLDLQHALGRFAAECEAAGMRVSTSKSEAMVLDRKKVACTLQVGGEVLPQVEEFKYLGVLFTSEGRMDREIDRRIGAAAAVMRSMYRSVVVKKELSWKAKLLIYQSIYVPTLTYGHELWVMTERVRSWIQAAEMSFLRRVAGHSLRDRVRSSVTWEGLGVEPLLLHIKRGQLRWLGHLFRMPLGRLPGEAFRACPTGKRPRGRPRTRWRDYVFQLAWECLRVPPEELEEVAREREVTGSLCLSQASLGIKAGYTLDRVPTHRRGHTLTMDNLEVPINLQCMSLDRGRKLEYPEETTEAQGEHANSTHTETGIEPPTLEGLELFVKNLDSWVDENYLRVELSQFGTITSVKVKGATEGRTSEINEELRTVKPGDWVYVKVFKRRWNKPRRVGPLKVILATPIALKVKRKNAWFHLNHCCRAPEPV